jgi:hypothetical protein
LHLFRDGDRSELYFQGLFFLGLYLDHLLDLFPYSPLEAHITGIEANRSPYLTFHGKGYLGARRVVGNDTGCLLHGAFVTLGVYLKRDFALTAGRDGSVMPSHAAPSPGSHALDLQRGLALVEDAKVVLNHCSLGNLLKVIDRLFYVDDWNGPCCLFLFCGLCNPGQKGQDQPCPQQLPNDCHDFTS